MAVSNPPLDRGYAKIRYGISNCGVEQASGGSPLRRCEVWINIREKVFTELSL